MNNNYDCDSCTRWICIHRNMFRRLPIREGGAGLCPGHISAPDSAQQPELEVNAQMGKLILNKEKFLKTELGKKTDRLCRWLGFYACRILELSYGF